MIILARSLSGLFYFVCLFVGFFLCVGFFFRIISALFLLCFLGDLLALIMSRLSLFGYALFKRLFLEICLLEQHTNKTTVLLLKMCKICQSIYYFWCFSVLALALVLKWIYIFLSTLRYWMLQFLVSSNSSWSIKMWFTLDTVFVNMALSYVINLFLY